MKDKQELLLNKPYCRLSNKLIPSISKKSSWNIKKTKRHNTLSTHPTELMTFRRNSKSIKTLKISKILELAPIPMCLDKDLSKVNSLTIPKCRVAICILSRAHSSP